MAPSFLKTAPIVPRAASVYARTAVIKKIKGKYTVLSETTGRSFGSYRTLAEAKKRLRQIEFFKHLSKSPSLRKTLRKKSLAR